MEFFRAQVREKRGATEKEKTLMKSKKKMGEIEKIQWKLDANEKVDKMQLPKLEKRDELQKEISKLEKEVNSVVDEEAKA